MIRDSVFWKSNDSIRDSAEYRIKSYDLMWFGKSAKFLIGYDLAVNEISSVTQLSNY